MTNKEEISMRLRLWADSKFKRTTDLAKALEMSLGALSSSYLNGRSIPGGDLLIKLANLGCDIHWLLTGEDKKPMHDIYVREDSPGYNVKPGRFPVVSVIGAGAVTPFDDNPPEYMNLPYNGEGVVLKIIGDSMTGLINEGDHVLVSTDRKIAPGHIVAIRTKAGEQSIKYYGGREGKTIHFYSNNPLYPPISFTADQLETVRKVVLIIKNVDYKLQPEVK
ncbi:MAG: LexA family transcriptional regulator [Ignavibacteriaceae bacterium]|nr:LexA family transcriptional regulator [Ignavibacteriaceae bacterium]